MHKDTRALAISKKMSIGSLQFGGLWNFMIFIKWSRFTDLFSANFSLSKRSKATISAGLRADPSVSRACSFRTISAICFSLKSSESSDILGILSSPVGSSETPGRRSCTTIALLILLLMMVGILLDPQLANFSPPKYLYFVTLGALFFATVSFKGRDATREGGKRRDKVTTKKR